MSTTTAPGKGKITFLELRFGDPSLPTILRICDSADVVTYRGDDYLPEPLMDIELSEHTGGLEEKANKVRLPAGRGIHPSIDAFVQDLSTPAPFSPIYVRIFEIQDSSTEKEVIHLGEGIVTLSRRNPDKRANLLEFEITPGKSQLDTIKTGISSTPSCVWNYGKNGCYVDTTRFFGGGDYYPNQSAKIRRATVEVHMFFTGIRTQIVTLIISATSHPSADNRTITQQPRGWWLGGYLVRAGLAIPIRDWFWNPAINAGTNQFVLGRMPPKSWNWNPVDDNRTVLIPGCSKDPDACRLRNNEINFGGPGWGMPAYNPLIDEDNR